MSEVISLLIGGLALFIYAISQLSAVLKSVFDEQARQTIERYTTNIFMGLLIGTVLTIILGSSSAVIVLTIVFINSRTLTFKQAIGIILGANIGTTFSSQIIVLDVGQYAIIPLFIGLFVQILYRKESYKAVGRVLFYFGMLFFGLFVMESTMAPLRDSQVFEEWILRIQDDPFRGALVGGAVTLIIQSSSATVGLAILLGKQNLISLTGGLSLMLGAELGTCSDTLIATINGSRQALKAGLFHFFFNLTTILLGLLLFDPFLNIVQLVSNHADIEHVIANGHFLFNFTGVLVILPFVRWFEKGLNIMIPEKAPQPTVF